MKRVHVFEFEDAPWFPRTLRRAMTRVLAVLGRLIGVPEALAPLVSEVLSAHQLRQVVDLGSGLGGIMPDVIERVRLEPGMRSANLLLTDLYPGSDDLQLLAGQAEYVAYERRAVNARELASAPFGLRTMVNCFHHMRPEEARQVLQSAQDSRSPLLIYEMGDNKMPFFLWLLTLPLGLLFVFVSCFVLTLKVRPLRPEQLVLTYLLPLVPLLYAWDGQASMPRIYTPEDLDELLSQLSSTTDYVWRRGRAPTPRGPKMGSYLLGQPRLSGDVSVASKG